MNDRLLTNGEALKALQKYPIHGGQKVELAHPVTEYIRIMEAQDAKTLKDVGGWLDVNEHTFASSLSRLDWLSDPHWIAFKDTLKKGELPE